MDQPRSAEVHPSADCRYGCRNKTRHAAMAGGPCVGVLGSSRTHYLAYVEITLTASELGWAMAEEIRSGSYSNCMNRASMQRVQQRRSERGTQHEQSDEVPHSLWMRVMRAIFGSQFSTVNFSERCFTSCPNPRLWQYYRKSDFRR